MTCGKCTLEYWTIWRVECFILTRIICSLFDKTMDISFCFTFKWVLLSLLFDNGKENVTPIRKAHSYLTGQLQKRMFV